MKSIRLILIVLMMLIGLLLFGSGRLYADDEEPIEENCKYVLDENGELVKVCEDDPNWGGSGCKYNCW